VRVDCRKEVFMKKKVIIMFIIILTVSIGFTANAIAQKKEGEAKAGMAKVTVPPVGSARTADEFSKEADYLVEARRSAISDGPSALIFKVSRCLKCHDNKEDVEGQIFYNYPDFRKDVNWPGYIGHADQKHAPSLKYDFYDMHAGKKKKVPITVGQDMEQRMKQMD
jgi:hypothetical protein